MPSRRRRMRGGAEEQQTGAPGAPLPKSPEGAIPGQAGQEQPAVVPTGGRRRRRGSRRTRMATKRHRKGSKKRTAGKWINHVKKYAKDNKISFKDAMSSSECKRSYKRM